MASNIGVIMLIAMLIGVAVNVIGNYISAGISMGFSRDLRKGIFLKIAKLSQGGCRRNRCSLAYWQRNK